MKTRIEVLFATGLGIAVVWTGVTTFARRADWDPARAAKYLDGRQQEWFAWKQAQSADGPCVSCHTGMPYLIARPALRRVLGEREPTIYESGLRSRLAAHAGHKPDAALQSVETIMAAMFVDDADARRQTFEQLWALQQTDGALKGGWRWYNANLDPWETPAQFRFGAALAALAIGSAPDDIKRSHEAEPRVQALVDFLTDDLAQRPMHVRVAVLWASTALHSVVSDSTKRAIVDDLVRSQQPDGGWTLAALGPWSDHPTAPTSFNVNGSNSYATAFTTYVLRLTAAKSGRASVERALAWLKLHQNRDTGAWPATSMNKTYPAGSMQEKFMQDAATAYAAAALAQ